MRSTVTGIAVTVVLLSFLAGTAPADAASETFHVKAANESGVLVKVVILRASGQQQKSEEISPGKSKVFEFGQKCKDTHKRGFEVYELAGSEHDKVATGSFTMETGKQVGGLLDPHCQSPTMTIDSCVDKSGSDDASVTCGLVKLSHEDHDTRSFAIVIQ